jgi:hypothetical protein
VAISATLTTPILSQARHSLNVFLPIPGWEQLPKPKTAHLITSNEKDQSFGARFLVHLEKIKQEPEYDAVLIDEAQDFDPSWFQCALRLMRDPHNDEQRMLFYVALTRAKDFLAAIPKECRDLLLFLLKMALYDREWLFAVIVIFSPFHALRANCSLSRSSLF